MAVTKTDSEKFPQDSKKCDLRQPECLVGGRKCMI